MAARRIFCGKRDGATLDLTDLVQQDRRSIVGLRSIPTTPDKGQGGGAELTGAVARQRYAAAANLMQNHDH